MSTPGPPSSGPLLPVKPRVTVTVEHHDTTTVLATVGELDHATTPRLVDSVNLALARQPTVLILDLSGVVFMTSAGLSALVAVRRGCGKHTQLRLVVTDRILRTLHRTGLAEVFTLYPTRTHALGPNGSPG
ncbi:STAS domain-containing protein [Amycolatopsis anabasis]|uniref:STAS domain-containing protein n=1 Tax=Amycolatopsis anabasis TaxID=1840409 RepID=UPI00131D09BC|nr:STAS domain-containing protein [Amycolatopsis anabasis]